MQNFDPKEYIVSLALRGGDIPFIEQTINGLLYAYPGSAGLLSSIMKALGKDPEPARVPGISRASIKLDLPVTDRCNLGCAACSHFAPIAGDAPMIPAEDMAASLAMLSEKCPGAVREIFVLGGEPLLHPGLPDILSSARKLFPVSSIYLVTNMLAADEKLPGLRQSLQGNGIVVGYSRYGKANERQVASGIEFCLRNNILYQLFGNDPASFVSYLKSETPDFPAVMKRECRMRTCLTLRGPYIYLCSPVTYLEYPNRAFGMHLSASRYDRVDIRDIEHPDEVLALSVLPHPFCRHCDVASNREIGWRPSRRERGEWFVGR